MTFISVYLEKQTGLTMEGTEHNIMSIMTLSVSIEVYKLLILRLLFVFYWLTHLYLSVVVYL